MIRRTISVMGKQAVYWERNPQWEQTIVMLHGFRGNHTGLTDMAQHFPGWRLILPDLPGYGESEPLDREHSPQNYAEWLDAFVGALGLSDWISWSHSYSGSIALIQAAGGQHAPQALVSVSPALPHGGLSNAVTTMYYHAGRIMPPRLRHRWISSRTVDHATGRWLFMSVSTKRRREIQRKAERYLPDLNVRVVTEQYLSALGTDLHQYAPEVKLPVLIIAGGRDIIAPLRRLEHMMRLMPDGTLVIIEDQGHLAPIERPAATATITKRWLAGL